MVRDASRGSEQHREVVGAAQEMLERHIKMLFRRHKAGTLPAEYDAESVAWMHRHLFSENEDYTISESSLGYAFANFPTPAHAKIPVSRVSISAPKTSIPIPGADSETGVSINLDCGYKKLVVIKNEIDRDNSYIGSSIPMLRVFEQIKLFNRNSDSPVLILGPSGAGKTRIAKLIHDSSSRSKNNFGIEHSSTNKSADMAFIISHWAGHAKNSTVKGVGPEGRDGLLQECHGGTIFVDEAHDFSPDFQDFLRPVIDRTPIHRSDGTGGPVTPNVRLIIATNENLEECVSSGKFKHDLYERIRHRQITIPDLNSRKEDIFEFVRRNSNDHIIDPGFYLALLNRSWPGNVRELLKAIELATIGASEGQPLTADLLELPTADKVTAMPKADIQGKLYAVLNAILEPQGFRYDKKGMALHLRMAQVMGVHPRKITKLKDAYDAMVASE